MPIHLDILTELQERSVQQAVDKLERRFNSVNANVGVDVKAAEIKAAAAKIQKEFGDIRQEIKVDVDDSSIRRATRGIKDMQRESKNLQSIIQEMGTAAFRTGRGLLTLGAIPAAAGLYNLVSVATTATQALYLLPAAATAAGAGIGTLALATQGFGQAMKDIGDPEKFAADLKSLSPNARQAALSIQALMPQLAALKDATQDAFFVDLGGRGGIIEQLTNTYLPTIQNMTTTIAGSFNQMFKEVSAQLLSPQVQTQISTIATNIGTAFQNAMPAVNSLVSAFINIADIGSSFLPGLASSFSNVAQQFADFIDEAARTGELRQWIQEGIDAVSLLAQAIKELATDFYNTFGSDAQSNINNFKDTLYTVREVFGLLRGDTKLFADDFKQEFELMQPAIDHWTSSMISGANRIAQAINDGPIKFLNFLLNQYNAIPLLPDVKIPNLPTFSVTPNAPTPSGMQPTLGGGSYTGATPTFGGTNPSTGAPTGPTIAVGPKQQGRGGGTRDTGRPAPPVGGPVPPGPTSQYPYTPPLTGPGGKPLSDKDRRAAIAAGIDPSQYKVDPYAGVPGLPQVATTSGPTGPSQYGGIGPVQQKYNAFGQPEGLGAYQVDPQKVLEAQHKVESDAHDLEQAKKDRLTLERDNQATAAEIEDAKWKETEAGWKLQASQADLSKAMTGTWDKMDQQGQGLTKGLDEIGASLDKDFGISKGLPGIAENLTKFIANLATADALGRMNALVAADPHKGGYGLIGIAGAQGAFGPQFTGLPDPTTGGATGPTQYGSASNPYSGGMGGMASAYASPGGARPGESARDFAHRVMKPFFESEGFTVGDHAADQYGEHQNGALDIMVPNIAAGNQVLQQVLSDPNTYGAIFNNQTYGYGHGTTPQDYSAGHTGDPSQDHMNHVHAFYKPGGTNNITPIAGGAMPTAGATYAGTASLGGAGIPIPLPVTISGMGGGMSLPFGGGGGGARGGAAGGGSPAGAGGGLSTEQWNNIMGAEAGGSGGWGANTGNGYYGGLQFTPSSWAAAGGTAYAPRADLATPEQQMAAGNRLLALQGPGAWPATSAAHPEWFATTGGSTANPATWAGPGLPSNISGGGQGPVLGPVGPMAGGAAGMGGLGPNPGALGGSAGAGLGPTPIGGLAPPAPNPGGGGVGIEPGGTIDTAMGIAASMFPGVGQAAATGMKLASRAIEYAGQVAGIGASGLMETFLPTGGSELANNSWLTRIVGGLAGASPALPNIAGGAMGKQQQQQQQAPVTPTDVASGQGNGPAPGPNINLEYHNHQATEDRAGADITNHLQTSYQTPGRR